jgi:hypothetical protein
MTTKPKLIVPKHVWDGAEKQKEKKELEKIPKPVGSGTFSSSFFFCSACAPSQTCFGTISFGLVIF